MFLIRILNILRGYVTIFVEGFFLERFLNICTRRGIYLWNVHKVSKTKMCANISIPAFKMLPPIAKKSRCQVTIRYKKGIPFKIYKHRKRKAFLIGIIIFALLLALMTRFVWVIDISGNENIPVDEILTQLQMAGLKSGMLKSKVDEQLIKNTVMTQNPNIAWLGVNLKGTTVMVEVKERAYKPPLFPKDEPCNIIAKTDGVIQTIDVTNGQKIVKKNDFVHEGQLLVSGALDSKQLGVRYVHADGTAVARTWHEKIVDLPQYEQIKTRTGKEKSKHNVKIFDFYIKFFINDRISYANYDRISYVKKISLGNHNVMPISFHHDKYYEVDIIDNEITNDQAVERIKSEMDNELKDVEIVNKIVSIEDNKLKITYECLENIGLKQHINIAE